MKHLITSLALVLATVAWTSWNTPADAQQPVQNLGGLKDLDLGVSVSPEDAVEIWAVLDKNIANYRMPVPDTIEAHLDTLVFPHVRIASGQIQNLPTRKSYRDAVIDPSVGMQTGWDHSVWKTRRIVQADDKKVHVVTSFDRLTKDNRLIATEHSLYILEKIDRHWGVRARSSFGEPKVD